MTDGLTSRPIQRVLMPLPADAAAMPLYMSTDDVSYLQPWEREVAHVDAGDRRSFAAYFNAFPAAWWRRHTSVRRIRFGAEVEGEAVVEVIASDTDGRTRVVERIETSGGRIEAEVALPVDVGWVWFDVLATTPANVRDAGWFVPSEAGRDVRPVVCITTLDRAADCVQTLTRLSDDPVSDLVSGIVVVDQGSREHVDEVPGFAEVAERLGDRLRVIRQANLGGSGGFSRGMLTAREMGGTHALLLDDDVIVEPDSIRRLAAFAAYATARDTVVGAQMLSTRDRVVLHSMGERVDPDAFWWVPVDTNLAPIHLDAHPLADTPQLHRPHEVDFNGWWMCLVPLDLVDRTGASMPYFIKWDDTEFGLRTSESGARTVTLPGAALWHVPWTAKDDGLDWQAYFQLRNRVATALVHAERRPRRLLSTSFAQDVNHVMCLQYGSVALRNRAMKDLLAGPRIFDEGGITRPADATAILEKYRQVVVPEEGQPSVDGATAVHVGPPHGRLRALWRLARIARHQLRPTRPEPGSVQFVLNRQDARWWRSGLLDDVVVRSATGEGGFVFHRDRAAALGLLWESAVLRRRMARAWPRLSARFRAEAPHLRSRQAWEARFARGAEG